MSNRCANGQTWPCPNTTKPGTSTLFACALPATGTDTTSGPHLPRRNAGNFTAYPPPREIKIPRRTETEEQPRQSREVARARKKWASKRPPTNTPVRGYLISAIFRGCCKKPKKSRIFGKRVQKLTKKEKEIRASLEKQLKDCGADLLHYQELLDDYIFFLRHGEENAGRS